jgi:hypothetical protein
MGAVFEALRRERIGTQIRDRRSNEEDGPDPARTADLFLDGSLDLP